MLCTAAIWMVAVLPLPKNLPLPRAKRSPKLLNAAFALPQPCVRAGAVKWKNSSSRTSALAKIDPLVWRGIISSTGEAEAGSAGEQPAKE